MKQLILIYLILQLSQLESDGNDPNGRRFRVEYGESHSDIEEVSNIIQQF